MSVPIVPAFIPTDETMVRSMAQQLDFSHELHIDVVDGRFVEAVSWPYQPVGDVLATKHWTDAFTLEVDLMVHDPIAAATAWVAAGADRLVFHIETISLETLTAFVRTTPVSVGVSFHGSTTLTTLLPYLAVADYVQIMGIETIGRQGEPFSKRTFDHISALKQYSPKLEISVDGSVNQDTIVPLVRAGAHRLIVGSAIVKQTDPALAYNALKQSVYEEQ